MRYTKPIEITFGMGVQDIAVIPETGVSVKVEYYTGVEWMEPQSSPIGALDTVFVCGCRVRFTPSPENSGFYLGYQE